MARGGLLGTCLLAVLLAARPAPAGPPYLTDDPEPTDYGHFEIYSFASGTTFKDGTAGEAGIDFNYGGAPDLQLTAVVPLAYDERGRTGFGNVELAAKYRFLHQEEDGLDISIFPRVFLPSGSSAVGDNHASLLVPVWAGRDFGKWSVFGGGGCAFNRSGESRNFCLGGLVLTRKVMEGLTLGMEIFHQGGDAAGSGATTVLGGGLTYDLNDHYHILAYWGPGLQNAATVGRATWYSAMLFTF
jgi:hypothetical protein